MKKNITASISILILTALASLASAQEALTLDQCVKMALQSNLRIETAGEKLNELDAAILEAAATQKPKLSATGSYTRLIPQPSGSQRVPVAANLAPFQNAIDSGYFGMIPRDKLFAPLVYQDFEATMSGNIYSLGLTLNHVLYSGGKIQNAKKISEQSREAAEWQLKSAIREIRRDVTKAYYTALAAKTSITALDNAISLMEVMVKDLGNAVDVGIRGENDLLQAKVQLANQRLQRKQAATGAQTAHDYLSTLIGVPVNTPVTLAEEMIAPETFRLPELPSLQAKARDVSTDIKALEKQLQILETSLLITDAANIPSVFASAGYSGGQSAGGAEKGKFTWKNNGTLTVGAQWDIYDGGAVKHKRAQTLSQKRQLNLAIENIKTNLDLAVKNNCATLTDAYESLEVDIENIAQTKRSYEISYDKFQVGLMLSSEVLNEQNKILQAEITYYAALSTYYSRLADLDYLINE
ncbi:MAG: TolC family protein [Chitinispirillales bacterium]|jgi:outer membrane protein|nr:TolC family protein [Chitinispirillales bacterium]